MDIDRYNMDTYGYGWIWIDMIWMDGYGYMDGWMDGYGWIWIWDMDRYG